MNEQPKLGQLITTPVGRDAVHVAIAPIVAGEDMGPAARVELIDGKAFMSSSEGGIGIVDPFLRAIVRKGQTFYLCLDPGTVTAVRHVYSHPAFTTQLPKEIGA